LDLGIEGDLDDTFSLAPQRSGALDGLLPLIELYPESVQNRLSVRKPKDANSAIWLHPGESIFDRLSQLVVCCYSLDALRGAVFVDPTAQQPYLFHIALVSVVAGTEACPTYNQHGTGGIEGGAGVPVPAISLNVGLLALHSTRTAPSKNALSSTCCC
jgi:hypothetical protein